MTDDKNLHLKFEKFSEQIKQKLTSAQDNNVALTGNTNRLLTEKTQALYISYVKTLRKRFLAVHPDAHIRDANPLDLVDLLLNQASTLRPKTFNSYRAGLLYWLNTLTPDSVIQQAVLALTTESPSGGFKGHKLGTTATKYSQRSMRARTFERQKFDMLKSELIQRASRIGDARLRSRASEVLSWLEAGLASGLRPTEWEFAQWQDMDKGELLVQTAKERLVYTLPSISHLIPPKDKRRVVHIDLDSVGLVNQHMLSVQRHLQTGGTFKQYYDNNRNNLLETCIDIFGSSGVRFTLYMMRGQYAANQKKAGLSLEALGREMGCGWHVASVGYGRKSAGHRGKGLADRISPEQKPKDVEQ